MHATIKQKKTWNKSVMAWTLDPGRKISGQAGLDSPYTYDVKLYEPSQISRVIPFGYFKPIDR
jgi:hypothetical protein